MFSALPKLADKDFIVGFFLPVLLFSFVSLILFSDLWPLSDVLWSEKANLEKLVHLTLAVWTLSILLLMLNYTQYQLIEGHLWPLNRIQGFSARERNRFLSMKKRIAELTDEWTQLRDGFPEKKQREYDELMRDLVKNFPKDEAQLLPTRFGNAIRAFEVYSSDVYGADGIALWPHLATVISKEMKGELEDAWSHVNFLINISCLAGLISLMTVARLLIHVATRTPPWIDWAALLNSTGLIFAILAGVSVVVCLVAYRASIQKIYIWGALVKAAFDCYLPDLAKKLGYQLPETSDDQRKFWTSVSQMAIYHCSMPSDRWPRTQVKDDGQISTANKQLATDETKEPEDETEASD